MKNNIPTSLKDVCTAAAPAIMLLGIKESDRFTLDSINTIDQYIDKYCPPDSNRQYTFISFGAYIAVTIAHLFNRKCENVDFFRDKYGYISVRIKGKNGGVSEAFTSNWCQKRMENGLEDFLPAKAILTLTLLRKAA